MLVVIRGRQVAKIRAILWEYTLWLVALLPQSAVAQRVLVVPESESRFVGLATDGSLDNTGDHIILCREQREVVLYDQQQLSEKVLFRDERLHDSWIDSQSGGLFVLVQSEMPNTHETKRLMFLKTADDWQEWKVSWSLSVSARKTHVQFLQQMHKFAFIEYPTGRVSSVRIFDPAYEASGDLEIKVRGVVGGIDEIGNRLYVYYSRESNSKGQFGIYRAEIDLESGSIRREEMIRPLDWSAINKTVPRGPLYGRHALELPDPTIGLRFLRMRGYASGDITRWATEVLDDRRYYASAEHFGLLQTDCYSNGRALFLREKGLAVSFGSNRDIKIRDVLPFDGGYRVLTWQTVPTESKKAFSNEFRLWDVSVE